MLRHPSILSFIQDFDINEGIFVATEGAMPLKRWILENCRSIHFNTMLSHGFKQIVQTVKFLNKSGFVHGRMCLESIFVTEKNEFKIFGLELLSKFDVEKGSNCFDKLFVRNSGRISHPFPELGSHSSTRTRYLNSMIGDDAWMIDSYAIGCLIANVFMFADNAKKARAKKITEKNEFKIFGLELLSKFDVEKGSNCFDKLFVRNSGRISHPFPELGSHSSTRTRYLNSMIGDDAWMIDSYAIGCLIANVFMFADNAKKARAKKITEENGTSKVEIDSVEGIDSKTCYSYSQSSVIPGLFLNVLLCAFDLS
eukprot:TRINITY_DN5042_c0_g1_i1.p1 TRINITY_DN5042_c0_g1~~TRINITY_DN5042_c0_g1_i1.p1  ORF type:complete len:349 (+),score=83.63 TRINITY_DN5042_c0_g1_i1:117-1049(+)